MTSLPPQPLLSLKRCNMSFLIKTISACGLLLTINACKEAPAAESKASTPVASASAEAAAPTPAAGAPLTIAYSDWPGFVAWEVAIKKGWFKEAGVNVEFHWFDYVPSMDAYNAGKVDAVGVTNGDQLVIASSGNKSQGIILTDYSDGNDMIVAKSGIKKLSDLKGKKIGVEVGFVDHLLLLYALKASNMAEKDVTLVNVPTDQTPQALKSGKVDAIGAWQPSSGTALREVAGSAPIFTSADVPGLIYDMIVVSPKSLAEHRADWLKVVGVWDRVAKFVTDPANMDEAATIMSGRVGLTPDAYKPLMKGTHILTLAAAQKAFVKDAGLMSVFGSSKVADDFNVKNAVYKVSQDANLFLDPSLTTAAMK
jgi:NitT/TauT family transport system substrate-binding protein